ncbi:GNAT family N-acetyltransferase [Microbacterium betulae]|uniref:GNAT family N-acetyltransferase n=1 Tax=Microbacterium betulae TaxID=2981139 RepID=A0AA97FFR7_9MICO|nr:GNAT family N-acetyltransferase [Microbacterium sp. AB]WOF22716.1 GNAT family N-acetyltransferase [Microbacterium sp. AB]
MDETAYEFSADAARIDRGWVHRTLSEHAYWAIGRSRALQDAAIDGSRCFGVYRRADGRQVAFARLVTDGATFGWLADVIVDPALRGEGVGKALVAGVAAELDALGLKRTLLMTSDAHGLYAQNGWGPVSSPENWLVRPGPDGRASF